MEQKYIYLLSTYDEYGSEGVRATFNRSLITEWVRKAKEPFLEEIENRDYEAEYRKWEEEKPSGIYMNYMTREEQEANRAHCRETIEKASAQDLQSLFDLFQKTDEEIHNDGNPHTLGRGWGGFQLHVVKVEE